jgi:hypothetical protein
MMFDFPFNVLKRPNELNVRSRGLTCRSLSGSEFLPSSQNLSQSELVLNPSLQ